MKLFHKKEILCPTVTGWLLLAGVVAGFLFTVLNGLYPFLAKNNVVKADVLVVEGWLEDSQVPVVLERFEKDGYQKIIATGCNINFARDLMPYKSYAETTYHRFIELGIPTNKIEWVSCGEIPRDRTYHSALALRDQLNGGSQSVNLVSAGPHCRRSQHLFELALGDAHEVGVISLVPETFNETNWWKSSDGVRTVISESIAWFYARWIFDPEELPSE